MLNRRKTLALIGASPAILHLPTLAHAHPETDLRTRLAAIRLPFAPAQIDLVDILHETDRAGMHHMRALVRLTWSPGMRQHYFTASGATPELAINAIASGVYQGFCAAAGITDKESPITA
jgi:hypothetical protein